MLPDGSWRRYESALRSVGERRAADDPALVEFLRSLELVQSGQDVLTPTGQAYFEAEFIAHDADRAEEVLSRALLQHCPEAAAIAQTLARHPEVTRDVAEAVLRNQGHGDGLTNRRLGSLLALMNAAGVIDYSKSTGTFRVLVQPLVEEAIPNSVFISPETPWSNVRWIRRILAEADEFVYWFDKHWLPMGLDLLGEAIDGTRTSTVRVLSLPLDESTSRRARRAYRDLGRELASRGVAFEWRFIDSQDVRGIHDRWIVTGGRSWNVPNLNAIISGQHSELVATTNAAELTALFDRVWQQATERPYDGGSV